VKGHVLDVAQNTALHRNSYFTALASEGGNRARLKSPGGPKEIRWFVVGSSLH
jgi:hypothetical protein